MTETVMKIAVASDHAGFALKRVLLKFLIQKGVSVQDCGVDAPRSVDYPDFAAEVARAVSSKQVDGGVLVCGTGLGMVITANKFKNVRASLVSDVYSARMTKEHNDANIIALGARVTDPAKAIRLVQAWLKATFKKGRHQNRIHKIGEIEKNNFR